MNLDSLSFALSHISYSVANLTKKNFKSSVTEISHLVAQHGAEAERHLIRCLFSHVDFSGDGKSSGKDFHQTQYLIQECGSLLSKSNFISTLCYAIDNSLHHQKTLRPTSQLFPQLSRVLKLSRVQEVAFGLALLQSTNADTANHALQFVRQKLPQLLSCYIQADSAANPDIQAIQDTPIEVLHLILTHLHTHQQVLNISDENKNAFIQALKKDFTVDSAPLVLSCLLYPTSYEIPKTKLLPETNTMAKLPENSLAEMIFEVGHGFTASPEECRNTLVQFGVRELTPAAVGRVLGMMAHHPSGITDGISVQTMNAQGSGVWDSKEKPETGGPSAWNVDIFVQVVKDLAPHLNWRDVTGEMDHPRFKVSEKSGLRLLMRGLFQGLQDVFPIECLYKPWKNAEGQLSWLTQSLEHPDVFCLADYMVHPVAVDILKTPPDDDNREIATWKSLELVETLLRLSDAGLYQPVSQLFKFPMQHCPDMLVLALLQTPLMVTLKHDLLSSLMPIFLGNHPNSGSVLHYAWHIQGQSNAIRTLIMRSMADWYMRGEHDQTRLSRMLDVAQDLKALSMLLNVTQFAFVIDLACLASRREYLKLDKWLTDKIRENGEAFVNACVGFLKRRCPQLRGGPMDDIQSKSQQLPAETIATMLSCLQSFAGNVNQELSETILAMLQNASMIMNKARSNPGSVVGSKAATLPPLSGLPNPAQPPNPMEQLGPIGPIGGLGTSMGSSIGNPIGTSLGSSIGTSMGSSIGTSMGSSIGTSMGSAIGSSMGSGMGSSMGSGMGSSMGSGMGSSMSSAIGSGMGSTIGSCMGSGMGSGIGSSMGSAIGSGMGSGIGSSMGSGMGSSMGSGMGSGMGSSMGSGMGSSMGSGMGSSMGSGMGSSMGSGMGSSMGSGMGSSMGGMAGTIGSGLGLAVSSGMSSAFPTSLSSLASSTPGSPAKAFTPTISQSQPFNPMQSLTSQLQGLSMGSTSLGGAGRTPTLAGLSAAAIKPQNPPGSTASLSPSTAATSDASSIFPANTQQFAKEIEDEANSYFQRIYNHPPHPTISIDEVLEMLKRFKDSPSKKEREVFACMLRNLFEEYRFFPQYPDKELHTTAVLFGGIIEQGLVTYMDLGIALRYVLEALKKTHASKMYYFGIAALDRFKTRLKDYPQYCQHLASIPHFSQFPQHLIEYVEFGARSQEPPNRPQGPVTSMVTMAPVGPPTTSISSTTATTTTTTTSSAPSPSVGNRPGSASMSKPSIANATNIDTLLAGTEGKEEVAIPPESVQDKVFFIFNNLSLANMDVKAAELKELMTGEYVAWVSQYLVMKRASIEPNFHTLYANFIDHLGNTDFINCVLNETFRNIKVLLRSDKGVANFSDRSLLKNLGHWLGMLTLAKNKPILYDDIDLKSLVYEANMKGAQELLYVIPFVAKVIESCAKSRIFRPPSPWSMAIMNVLAELHQTPGLKLNLKFEIEVLCKTLNIDLNNDLKVVTYLRDPNRAATMIYQLSAPKAKESSSTPQPEEPMVVSMPVPGPPPVPPPSAPVSSTPPVSQPQPSVVSAVLMQPQFSYQDINIMASNGIDRLITINEQLQMSLFQAHPQLKQLVRQAIERAIQELLPPVVERSIKIALTTCEQIAKKDFALDPEESRMRAAAHHMVRNMTAGMALITCREPLHISITNNLKTMFQNTLRQGATQAQKDLIEQAAQLIAQDNTELACAFIQKTAVEKATPEIDKKLAPEFELRKLARAEGRRYCDPVVLTYQAERMPEQIRLKVGGVTNQQFSVYEEFVRNMPGFQPNMPTNTHNLSAFSLPLSNTDTPPPHVPPPQPQSGMPQAVGSVMPDDITQIYEKITREIEITHLQTLTLGSTPNNPQLVQIHTLMDAIRMAANSREVIAALSLLQKAVEGLLDGLSAMAPTEHEAMLRFRDCHLLVLKGLQDPRAYGPQWTNKQVTRCLMECREDYRYNVEAVEVLIRAHLVNMPAYDQHLAGSMENGLNYMAVAFTMQLVQRFCLDDKHGNHDSDFYNTIETLARIATHSRQAPEGLAALIEMIRQRTDTGLLERAPGGPTSMMHSGINQAREFDDPPGLHEKTEFLLREWVNMYHSPAAGRDSTKAFTAFVGQMHSQGILKTDDLITRFFRLCTEMCVDLCYRALAEQSHSPSLVRAKCFHTLDAFVRLIALLVKHSGDTANTVTKINLLNKVLGIVAGVLLQDHEVRHTEFQQLPYHRIFIMLFIELNAPEHVLESINFQVLTAFCNTYHILRPAKAPGFSYAWLELVSHRVFIGRMLAITPQQRGWSMYAQLLIDLFKYLAPFLRNAELGKPTQLLYKGTLRVLLVLLHDFPEFLCNYHYAFCDVIPPNCIQMRNLILSAFPRNMRLPDPFTPNLKVDMLPEINHAPHIMTNFANMIQPATFKKDLDSYLKTRSPVTFLSDLRSNLQVSNEPGNRYNIALINALVLYVGTQAIQEIHRQGLTPSMSTIAHSSHMDIFQNLAVDLDTEGRYLFLNAIANQLRYPNSHTHYFSCTLLYLFAEANAEAIQEQITRVLLERLIVSRPHPWGLLITFIELIKNPQFRFWNHEFVHCAPEISKLFDSVARSCMQTRTPHNVREDVPEAH